MIIRIQMTLKFTVLTKTPLELTAREPQITPRGVFAYISVKTSPSSIGLTSNCLMKQLFVKSRLTEIKNFSLCLATALPAKIVPPPANMSN